MHLGPSNNVYENFGMAENTGDEPLYANASVPNNDGNDVIQALSLNLTLSSVMSFSVPNIYSLINAKLTMLTI